MFDDSKIMDNEPNFQEKESYPTIIKIIGVGGGGNNAVNHMYEQNISGVSFVVCNTDKQALLNSPVPKKLLLGPNTTHGLGAGNMPDVARNAADESENEIAGLFDDATKVVFITAGMGGGTGTGAAPVVARIAKEKGVLTVGIVTIPFLFEGEKKIMKALKGAEEMKQFVDALMIINNERLTEIYEELDFLNAFGKADDTLTTAARSISELITSQGRINLDFNDVNTTLRDGGVAIISSGYGEGERRMTKAIRDALNSPLLKNRDVYSSKRILVNIYFAEQKEHPFVMSEIKEMQEFMAQFATEVDVIWGVTVDNTLGSKIKVTILAAGFDVSLGKETSGHSDDAPKEPKITIEEVYGSDAVAQTNQSRAKNKYMVLKPEELDDDAVISVFEKNPTFKRGSKVHVPVIQDSAGDEDSGNSTKNNGSGSKKIQF